MIGEDRPEIGNGEGGKQESQPAIGDQGRERRPRLGLIRVFLSVLVGFMAGLVGWMVVLMVILIQRGPAVTSRLPNLPLPLHAIAFGAPALLAGYWIFGVLGSRG